jgi:hypothetical protein
MDFGFPLCFVCVCALPASARTKHGIQPVSARSLSRSTPAVRPSGVSVRIKNVSGKRIVGLVFNAALADATEHWKWLRWDFDESRPVGEFGWNKLIKNGEVKKLSWYRADIAFEHGGGAFVLTSALFEDGSVS